MTAEGIFCPYCNAEQSVRPEEVDGRSFSCWRCGETIRSDKGRPPAAASTASEVVTPARPPWSNRQTAGLVLSAMACMAVIGLAFALATQKTRRSRDRGPEPTPVPYAPATRFYVPAKLPGLDSVPADSEVIAGVHVAEMLALPAGRELLDRWERSGAGRGFAQWRNATGLQLSDLDHVLIAVSFAEQSPRATVVAVANRAIDPDRVREGLKSAPVPIFDVAFPTDQTLVMTYPGRQTAGKRPRPGEPADPRELVRLHVASDAVLWIAGRSPPAELMRLILAGSDLFRLGEVLPLVRAFGVGLALSEAATLTAALDASHEAAASNVEKFLADRIPEGFTASYARTATRVTVQAKGSTSALFQALDAPQRRDPK